jgi:hypothetical protein
MPAYRRLCRLCCVVLVPATLGAQGVVTVPRGSAPVIDGRVTPDEWRGPSSQRLADGSELLLRHDGRFLYLALRAAKAGFISACVARNDSVHVLHASAALGTAVYVRRDSTWALASGFQWAVRAREMNDDTRRRQQEFLAGSRWLGSTFGLSETGKEMQIDLELLGRNDLRIAFGYYVANDGPVIAWPATLTDACPDQKVVSGFLPQTAKFDRRAWAQLRLGS